MQTTSEQTAKLHFSAFDGRQIFWQHQIPENPRANILLVHGFGEHSSRYDELALELLERQFAVFRFDLRGHGRSDGKRGHIFNFDEYLKDFSSFKHQCLSHPLAASKSILMGHSYGGLIATSIITRDPSDFSALVLSSPFFGLADGVPKWKVSLGKVLSAVLPTLSLPTDIDPNDVSHDPQTRQEYATDTLITRTASTRWLTESLAAQETLRDAASKVSLPVILQQAGDDRLVSAKASREIFEKFSSKDKRWTEYSEMFHEIWFESDRSKPLGEVFEWLEERY